MIYQLVWATRDEEVFEQVVPLQWHGEYILNKGWQNNIRVGFLEGIDLLSKDYLRSLEGLGYEVIDCQPLVGKLLKEYPQLNGYDATNKYWLLRWNVLDVLAGECATDDTIIHLDADVVLMADPHELCKDVHGKTFVLEGCPVFTAISCKEWFEVWRDELANYLGNPESYLGEALRIREHPLREPREFCNALYYGPGRFHDQDMLEYLISAGKLPQASTSEVFASRFYWMQNPIIPGEWFEEQCPGRRRWITEDENGAIVGDKQIAFYHVQMNFARYCLQWTKLQKVGLASWVPMVRGNPERNYLPISGKILARAIKYLNWGEDKNRRAICRAVLKKNPHTNNTYITDIVNSCW